MNRPRWPYPTKLAVSLLLLALVIYLLARFSAAIPPLILAFILAFILTPIVNSIQTRLKIPRWLAILFGYLLALLFLAAIPALIIPTFAAQFSDLNLDMQRILGELQSLLGRQFNLFGYTLDTRAAFAQLVAGLQGLVEPVIGQSLALVVGIISSMVWIVFIIVVSFYLIRDSARLSHWVDEHIPPAYFADYIWLRDELNQIWSAFFRSQLLLGAIVASGFTIIGFILGMPFALVMGLFAGLMEFLPSVGHGIWLFTASLLAYFLGSTWLPLPNWLFMLVIIVLHLFFEQFDLNYLIPRIIGRSVHLPPLVVILGIVAGAVLAGVLGIPLAAPTIASARIVARYIFSNLLDLEPLPASAAMPLPPPNPRWWQRTHRRGISQ